MSKLEITVCINSFEPLVIGKICISSCEYNKVVSAFLMFCKRGDFVFQTLFLDCWKFKRKEKLNRIKILLFLYDINDLLFLIQNH